jgi:DNA invertase Pin-like site-specific DNA recombinase
MAKTVPQENPETGYRVAIYARLSVEDNGTGSDSIESQIAFLEDYIARQADFRETAVFVDNGYTGTNFLRPEFQRMLHAAQRGEINCVVVKDLSRLGRNYVETGEFLEKVCPFLGLRFIAVNDGYDSAAPNANSQLAAALSNIVNDLYAKDISRKVTTALRAKMERGDYIGNYAPYGYRKDPANKNHLLVEPETAAVVRRIYEARAAGASYSAINRMLNQEAIPSPGAWRWMQGILTNNNQAGRKLLWNKHVLMDLLNNRTYLGHLAQRRGSQCLYAGLPYHAVEESQWITVENTHEAIISEELFAQVQAVNAASVQRSKAAYGKYDALPKEKNLYGGKLVCADCGARMKLHRSISQKGDKVYFTYKCSTYAEHGALGCTSHKLRKADLDAAVLQTIRTQMDLFLKAGNATVHGTQKQLEQAEQAALTHRLQRLRTASLTLYTDLKDGLLTEDEYVLQKETYRAEVQALEQKLWLLDAAEKKDAKTAKKPQSWTTLVNRYRNVKELDSDLLEAFVKQIRVHADGTLEVCFNYMDAFDEAQTAACLPEQEVC